MLEIKEKNGIIEIEEYSDSTGGFKVVFAEEGTFELYEIKPDGPESLDSYHQNIYDAINEGRRWT